jgi:hypothetical protein
MIANIIAAIAVTAVFATFIVAITRFDVFGDASHGGAQPVAAAIALVGAFMTAVASILGILLKYSVDGRAEQRLQEEARRNAAIHEQAAEQIRLNADRNLVLQREAECRLKLEVATQAVKLLTTTDGGIAPHLQRAGALFTLVNLGEYELTLSLVSELIKHSAIEPPLAARLLNAILMRGGDTVQRDAAWLLYEHAKEFLTPTGFEFPSVLLDDVKSRPKYVREWTYRAWGRMFLARSVDEWRKQLDVVYALVAALSLAWMHETDERLRKDLAAVIGPVLVAFPYARRINNPIQDIDLLRVRAEVTATESPVTAGMSEFSRELLLWSEVVPA